jgi:hypothetical protein
MRSKASPIPDILFQRTLVSRAVASTRTFAEKDSVTTSLNYPVFKGLRLDAANAVDDVRGGKLIPTFSAFGSTHFQPALVTAKGAP